MQMCTFYVLNLSRIISDQDQITVHVFLVPCTLNALVESLILILHLAV